MKKKIELKQHDLLTKEEKSKFISFRNWKPNAKIISKCIRYD
jgi:hypothetical protein